MKRREFLKASVLAPVAGLIALDNTVTSTTNEVVDDSMVGRYFGVSSYEEYQPFVGPFKKVDDHWVLRYYRWIEDNPETYKRQIWESTRRTIQKELQGINLSHFTRDGQVRFQWQLPGVYSPIAPLMPGDVIEIPIAPSNRVARAVLNDNGSICSEMAVEPTDERYPPQGGIGDEDGYKIHLRFGFVELCAPIFMDICNEGYELML